MTSEGILPGTRINHDAGSKLRLACRVASWGGLTAVGGAGAKAFRRKLRGVLIYSGKTREKQPKKKKNKQWTQAMVGSRCVGGVAGAPD